MATLACRIASGKIMPHITHVEHDNPNSDIQTITFGVCSRHGHSLVFTRKPFKTAWDYMQQGTWKHLPELSCPIDPIHVRIKDVPHAQEFLYPFEWTISQIHLGYVALCLAFDAYPRTKRSDRMAPCKFIKALLAGEHTAQQPVPDVNNYRTSEQCRAGRIFPINPGLTNIPEVFRRSVLCYNHHEYDMVNAHLSIFMSIMEIGDEFPFDIIRSSAASKQKRDLLFSEVPECKTMISALFNVKDPMHENSLHQRHARRHAGVLPEWYMSLLQAVSNMRETAILR